ncbi:MAG: cytochrome C oxidase subunit IV family protein [bacterium]
MSEHEEHGTSFYVKIWAILLVLLVVSVIGPEFGIKWVTLLTAFGIAIVKAYLVVVNFMHINMTPRYVIYAVTTTLVFMLLFFAGAAPDVMKSSGHNWEKPAWIQAEADYAAHGAGGAAGHGGGHDSHAEESAHGGGGSATH